jgi:hypothetical protein
MSHANEVVVAAGPCEPPKWAVLQRRLFDVLDGAWRAFEDRYTERDGRLVFHDRLGVPPDDRDGVDDFYEAFFNWPALYLLGGADDLLPAAKRHWEGVTAQLTELGMLAGEYERGYDWFHQGEGLLFFYFLCLADPADSRFRERAERFAGLYLGEAPGNYDAARNIIRAPHVGADGPRPGLGGGEPYFPWSPDGFAPYGLPLEGIDGITSYNQLLTDDRLARRMGRVMREAMGRGDTAVNLASTSLAANAFMLTGDHRYQAWVLRYVEGWLDRTRANNGILPDNVGLSGTVGEYLDGRWYGAHYGWSWPHGLHSVGTAAVVGSMNAALLSRDDGYLDLGRAPLDLVMTQARRLAPRSTPMSMGERWAERFAGLEDRESLLVPYRISASGWHDYHPMQSALPTALWHHSQAGADLERLRRLEAGSSYEWSAVHAFRDKEEAGHEEPWLAYLDGRNPGYPEQILQAALQVVEDRLMRMASDPTDAVTGPATEDIHLWQNMNPVATEALTQLCFGAPQVLYNGGLLQARLRYYDGDRDRPGLPPGVAALVERIDPAATALTLVNLDPAAPHRVIVQAGAFAEHRIQAVRRSRLGDSQSPGPTTDWQALTETGPFLEVELGPSAGLRLDLRLALRADAPSYRRPWDAS